MKLADIQELLPYQRYRRPSWNCQAIWWTGETFELDHGRWVESVGPNGLPKFVRVEEWTPSEEDREADDYQGACLPPEPEA